MDLVTAAAERSERIECPVCAGRGTTRGRAFRRGGTPRFVCGLCEGDGSVTAERIRAMEQLRRQMQRVADAMQAGDDDRAARETRIAVRLARRALT